VSTTPPNWPTLTPVGGKSGMTVAEAVKAGVPRGYVAWDVAHGFITLKPAC
jgi:hypothetical protein